MFENLAQEELAALDEVMSTARQDLSRARIASWRDAPQRDAMEAIKAELLSVKNEVFGLWFNCKTEDHEPASWHLTRAADVTVYLNRTTRDKWLGLNTTLVEDDTEKGYHRVVTPKSHELERVFRFWTGRQGPRDEEVLNRTWELLNVGDDPEFDADPETLKLAREYRARPASWSLSVGDVVQVNSHYYSVDSCGFTEVPRYQLNVTN